jgi:hypothetical protein
MIPKTLTVTKNPILALTESEYLLLKMATQPKNSLSYYLNALKKYLNSDDISINTPIYILTPNYIEMIMDGYQTPIYMLTPKGMEIAMVAAKKIGLTLTWSIQ